MNFKIDKTILDATTHCEYNFECLENKNHFAYSRKYTIVLMMPFILLIAASLVPITKLILENLQYVSALQEKKYIINIICN